MTRLIAALLWLRWRSLVNGLARRRKRSPSQRMAGWLEAAASTILVILGVVLAAGIAAAGLLGGLAAARDEAARPVLAFMVRIVLLSALAMVIVTPLQAATSGRSPTRLLLLPVSHASLHVAGLMMSLATPLVFLTAPGLLALPVGLAMGGAPLAALACAPAALAMIALLMAFDALASSAAQWTLRDRRRGEIMALAVLLVVTSASFIPAFVASRLDDGDARAATAPPAAGSPLPEADVAEVAAKFGWADHLPPGLYARALDASIAGEFGRAAGLTGLLIAIAAMGLVASFALHRRLLLEPARTGRRAVARAVGAGGLHIPWLPPAALAVAAATFVTIMRTVRGKLATLTPALVAALVSVTLTRTGLPLFGPATSSAAALLGWTLAVTALNLLPMSLNAYAVDRAGTTLTFMLPARDRDIVVGKFLGYGALGAVAMALGVVAAAMLGPAAPPGAWAVEIGGALVTWVLLAPLALVISARLPKPADIAQMQGQQPHAAAIVAGLASLLGVMILARGLPALASATLGASAAAAAMALLLVLSAGAGVLLGRLAIAELAASREPVAMASEGR